MKVPILCYHSCHAGNDYATDDHIALAEDLRTIYRRGYRVVPLDWIVEALLGDRGPLERCVALTCDDGVDLDWVDADHPTYGRHIELGVKGAASAVENAFAELLGGLRAQGAEMGPELVRP